MKRNRSVWWLAVVMGLSVVAQAEMKPEASRGFDQYVSAVERRLVSQMSAPGRFVEVSSVTDGWARLLGGEVTVQRMETPEVEDALLHHWRGTVLMKGATVPQVMQVLGDYGRFPQYYSPEVKGTQVLWRKGDRVGVRMRFVRKKVMTVVMDADYDVTFGKVSAGRAWTASRSVGVREVEDAGTAKERVLGPEDEHGYLWRLNSYWRLEQRPEGVLAECEAVSLTRNIPRGLGWAVKPFIESVPRESLEFTLTKTRDAVLGR